MTTNTLATDTICIGTSPKNMRLVNDGAYSTIVGYEIGGRDIFNKEGRNVGFKAFDGVGCLEGGAGGVLEK